MTAHLHAEFLEGCYRCDLSRDEVPAASVSPAPGRDDTTGAADEHANDPEYRCQGCGATADAPCNPGCPDDPEHPAATPGRDEQDAAGGRCPSCGPGYRYGDEGCQHTPAATPVRDELREQIAAAMVAAGVSSEWLDVPNADKALVAAYHAGVAAHTEQVAALRAALADCVTKAYDYGQQDGDFVAMYLIPAGPIHRAIPLLQEYGVTARPRPWRHHYVETGKVGEHFGWWCLAPGCGARDDDYRSEHAAKKAASGHRSKEVVEAALSYGPARELREARAAVARVRARCDEAMTAERLWSRPDDGVRVAHAVVTVRHVHAALDPPTEGQ